MSEVLGLLDSVEAAILEGKRVPLTDYVVLDEKKILSMLDKLRLTLQSQGRAVYESFDKAQEPVVLAQPQEGDFEKFYREALEIRKGADQYADHVLANLLLLITKMQKNLINMEKSLEGGRELIDKNKQPVHPSERLEG